MGDGSQIYAKPLSDGSFAVGLLNLGNCQNSRIPVASHDCVACDWSQSCQSLTSFATGCLTVGGATANVSVAWSTLGPTMASHTATVRDLWERKDLGSHRDSFSAEVLGHGVEIIKVTPQLT